jgi:hypothetical protein
LGFRITFKMVQVYQICNHTALYISWQCTPFVCPTERTMRIWTLCALVNLLFTVRHWGNSMSCTKSHVPRIEHDKKGAFIISELSKRIDVLLFPLILSKGFRGLKVRQKKWRPYRHTQIEGSLQNMLQSSDCLLQIPSFPQNGGKKNLPKERFA